MLNRFFLPDPLEIGSDVQLVDEEFHHAIRVHRTRVGDLVELFDGKGRNVLARLISIGKTAAAFRVESTVDQGRESPLALTLAPALIQPEKFELVLQKGTELGAQRFAPIVTDLTEVRSERASSKRSRWEKIVLEAVKQSGRSVIPRIDDPVTLVTLFEANVPDFWFFDSDETPDSMPQAIGSATVLIGPEGGWSAGERGLARERKAIIASLGPRRLRAETAAIAAIVMLVARYDSAR